MNKEIQSSSGLKIIKARVEQDKYAAVELKIIKANGKEILKDLYVESEMNNGELYVVSDNVLVSLHRALRSGEVANLQLITSTGEVLMNPDFSEIKQAEGNLFVGVKAISNMISIKNNQALKTDALKVQEIAADCKIIKDQMISTMKLNNPNSDRELRFIYEDAYNEAAVYNIEKVDGKYTAKLVGDKASFIATDGLNVYSHSNIVADITKVVKVRDEEVVVKDIEKPIVKEKTRFRFGRINNSVSMFDRYAPKASIVTPKVETSEPVEISLDKVEMPEVVAQEIMPKENFFDDAEANKIEPESIEFTNEDTDSVVLEDEKATPSEDSSHTFDEFFGVSDSSDDSGTSMELDSYGSSDKYEQLGEMISKLVTEQKETKNRIAEYEAQVKEMEERLSKANQEIETKTKKVNTLINQNRQFGDENRTLKNRVSGLENKVERLEQSNEQYLKENDMLKAEANKDSAKLNGIISSVSELLGSYGDEDSTYAVKKKVA